MGFSTHPCTGARATLEPQATSLRKAAPSPSTRAFFGRFGDRLPRELEGSLGALEHDLASLAV